MSEREPITTELRDAVDYAPQFLAPDVAQVDAGEFDRCCDAIDAVNAGLERENAELRRQLDSLLHECRPMTDKNMAEHGWVRLPLDADGVPIHVGDEVVDELDESTAPRKVTSLYLANDGWWVYIGSIGRRPSRYSHHHAPTVEDVLRELLDEAEHFHSLEEERDAIAEYAAKLRLAGDAE